MNLLIHRFQSRCRDRGAPCLGHPCSVEPDGHQHLSMLRILYGASAAALDAF
jgi:hypothetical protein